MGPSLREAFNYRGCAICHMLDRDESDFMAQLQYKIVKDEKVRQQLGKDVWHSVPKGFSISK